MYLARDAVIQYENRVLLDKMMEIEKKKTDLNPTIIAKKHFYPTKSLNTTKRVRELKKVNTENKVNLDSPIKTYPLFYRIC